MEPFAFFKVRCGHSMKDGLRGGGWRLGEATMLNQVRNYKKVSHLIDVRIETRGQRSRRLQGNVSSN